MSENQKNQPKLAILHTTTATVDLLKSHILELLPGWGVLHIVDESILPSLAQSGGDLEPVRDVMLQYAGFAEQAGADVILEACSSIGELVPEMRRSVSIPVVRIDEPMAEAAVKNGGCLGVAATVSTSMAPTLRLLQEKSSAAGTDLVIKPALVEEAFRRLSVGDREGHDNLLAEALLQLAGETDAVVLAQASMSRVVAILPAEIQSRFLSSPRLALQQVKKSVELLDG
jgi:glutamate racemase